LDVRGKAKSRISRNQRFTDVHTRDARNRLRRSISSLDASLVRIRPALNAIGLWQVFILRVRDDVVGVSGLYRQPGMAQTVCWVGWFAIRPGFRRQGFGKSAMDALIDFAKSIQAKELWVYTGSADDIAVSFYKSLGFELLGPAADWAPGRTMDDSDIVLRRML